MAKPEPLSVDDALDRLVNQFSDSMAFFRELIQNSLDAGSQEVEIDFVHEGGKLVVHVNDWGAGMNREIIDTRLTRLFSSSKDGDRTKIGKFGIGFVSVFAIEPEAVCIDTGRAGEHWRIVFDERRRFQLVRLDQPVEGTQIRIFKQMDRRAFNRFRERAAEVIAYWCRHVRGDVRVEGELINEPFTLDVPISAEAKLVDGEHIIVGHRDDGASFAGFYNRGLTLCEQEMIPGVAFKADSPKLEHTLTRDDVIREAGFERLMRSVRELVATKLCAAVFEALRDAVVKRAGAMGPSAAGLPELSEDDAWVLAYLWRCAAVHEKSPAKLAEGCAAMPVFVSPGGQTWTLEDLRRPAKREVVVATRRSELTAKLEAEGHLVVWLPRVREDEGKDEGSSPAWAAAYAAGRALLERVAPAVVEVEAWCTALPPRNSEEAQRWQILAAQVARLLDTWGAKVGGVHLGHLDYAGSAVREAVAITQAQFGELTRTEDCGELGRGLFASRRVVVLNADHPSVRTIAALAVDEPELGAYMAVKAFFLGRQLDAETDEALLVATHAARERRRVRSAGAREVTP